MTGLVGALCGIHGQLQSTVELSIGLRVAEATAAAVRHALWADRTLVRTYGLRGTIHVYPSQELPLWLAALRALPRPNESAALEAIGLSAAAAERLIREIADAVDGTPITLPELERRVGERVGTWVATKRGEAFGVGWSRVRSMLGRACLEGAICFGPNDGNRVTFVRPEAWLGPQLPVDADVALGTFVRRYVAAYGPSTEREFGEWTATSPAAARRAFDLVRDDLVPVAVEGDRRWWTGEALDAASTHGTKSGEASVHLLPHFDVYLVGSRPRDVLVPPAVQATAAPRGLRRYDLHAPIPILVVDGRVAGVWQRTVSPRQVRIVVEPLVEVPAAVKAAVERAADRIGAVLGRTASIAFGSVDAKPHM